MDLVVQTPDELLAAVPHVLGFKAEESIVLVPFSKGLPVVRVDLPRTLEDRQELLDTLRGPLVRNARPGAMVAVICITEDRRGAELASQHLASGLEREGIGAPLRLWANGERWVDFNTGEAGFQTEAAASRIAAETVVAGAAQPAANRNSLAASLIGDRGPIKAALPSARAAAENSTASVERDWALDRLEQFHADGHRLSDVDGARMLVGLETIGTRDALWEDMSRENTPSHISLWTDLTRRAPDDVRAAPASMLGFSSWLRGDGARAWCALDQVPAERPYPMAAIVASALQNGLHPQEWEKNHAELRSIASDLDESFVPKPPSPREDHDIPRGPIGPDHAAPGR
jgi:hypothetical protein